MTAYVNDARLAEVKMDGYVNGTKYGLRDNSAAGLQPSYENFQVVQGEPAAGPAPAEQPLPPDLDFVAANARGFLSVRPSEILQGQIGQILRQVFGAGADALYGLEQKIHVDSRQMERVTMGLVSDERVAKQLGVLLAVHTSQPLAPAKLQQPGDQPRQHGRITYYVRKEWFNPLPTALALVDEHTLLETWEAVMPRVLDRQLSPQTADQLRAALRPALARKHDAVFAMEGATLFQALGEALPAEWLKLPAALEPLRQLQFVTATMDISDEIEAGVVLTFSGPGPAKAGEQAVRAGLQMLPGMLAQALQEKPQEYQRSQALQRFVQNLQTAAARAPVVRTDNVVRVAFRMPVDIGGLLRALVQAQRVAESRPSDAKNLRTIADGLMAMKFFNRTHRFTPNAIFDKDGKPLLSWRVALLEKTGDGQLFKEFKLDEPWTVRIISSCSRECLHFTLR